LNLVKNHTQTTVWQNVCVASMHKQTTESARAVCAKRMAPETMCRRRCVCVQALCAEDSVNCVVKEMCVHYNKRILHKPENSIIYRDIK